MSTGQAARHVFSVALLISMPLQLLAEKRYKKTTGCTAVAVGRLATTDGSTFATQSVDENMNDYRLFSIPRRKNIDPRPVYRYGDNPRVVSDSLGPGYAPENGQKAQEPLGYIPGVEETFSYLDGSYGHQNEHGLSIGETTTSAKLYALPVDAPHGTALFGIAELTRVAMERCKTAQCAIRLMGNVSETYGFYGDDGGDVSIAGEALAIADASGEAWIFHIMADPTGKSSIWAAQRVPDEEAAVCANMWVIREMDLDDHANFLASANAPTIAQQMGWWDGQGKFDWTKSYSLGEYFNPFYASRRHWRVLSLFAPSLRLDSHARCTAASSALPFSVKPDFLITLKDIFAIYRDHYDGTEFDTTKGLAAGPFGSPTRYDAGMSNVGAGSPGFTVGAWERTISTYRTAYAVIGQSGGRSTRLPGVLWFAPHSPHTSVFVPVLPLVQYVPLALRTGTQLKVDHGALWWAFSTVSNWADMKYSYMIHDIRRKQVEWEDRLQTWVGYLFDHFPDAAHSSEQIMQELLSDWWNLFWSLVQRYNNGYINSNTVVSEIGQVVSYPHEFLERAGFGAFPHDYTPEDGARMFETMVRTMEAGQMAADAVIAKRSNNDAPVRDSRPGSVAWKSNNMAVVFR